MGVKSGYPYMMLPEGKPKPRWDVHLLDIGNQAGGLALVPRPLIAGLYGSAVSPHPSARPVRLGSCRKGLAPGCLASVLAVAVSDIC